MPGSASAMAVVTMPPIEWPMITGDSTPWSSRNATASAALASIEESWSRGHSESPCPRWSSASTWYRSARCRLTRSHECADWLPPCSSSSSGRPGSPHSSKWKRRLRTTVWRER